MIDGLFDFFSKLLEEPDTEDNEELIQLAAAALLLEVARSDTDHHTMEIEVVRNALSTTFTIGESEIETLIATGSQKVEEAHDLYQFTQLINEHFDYGQKEALLYAMWQVAFADGKIQAIEDHIIRRVAGLIHLAHEDFIRLKIKARNA